MECSCEIEGCDQENEYEDPEVQILIFESKLITLKCCECGCIIEYGSKYEWYRGYYGGESHTHHTCLDCLSLRNYFFNGWMFSQIWEDFESNMYECDWVVPESCLSKLTPGARAKVCEFIELSWED